MVKKKDKTEDGIVAVEEVLGKTEQFIENNQKVLTLIVGVIVILILGFFAFKRFYVEPRETEAREQIFMAEKYFEMDSLNLALFGDGNYPGFLDIIDDYSLTSTANLAKYYAGISYLNMGDFESAIEYLDSYTGKDQIVAPMALGAMGDAYMEQDNPGKAVSYYIDAAEENVNDFTSPLFYLKAGWTYELLGEYGKALKIYNKIQKEFPKSNEAREIDKYIARAAGMLNK